jgi:hypothetical protein
MAQPYEEKDVVDAYTAPGMTYPTPIAMQPTAMRSMALDAGLSRDDKGQRKWRHGLCGFTDGCGFCEHPT